jgi:hypothetical protein
MAVVELLFNYVIVLGMVTKRKEPTIGLINRTKLAFGTRCCLYLPHGKQILLP